MEAGRRGYADGNSNVGARGADGIGIARSDLCERGTQFGRARVAGVLARGDPAHLAPSGGRGGGCVRPRAGGVPGRDCDCAALGAMTHIRIAKKVPPAFSLDVEFDINGVTALFGPAGAGKTLILEAVAGFARPDSGRTLRDNVLLFDAEARVGVPARRRGCGYLPQRDALFPHITVRQNLAFAASGGRLEGHRRVAEAIEKFGFAEAALRRPAELDAAQRTRAAVARALIAGPKLLLLDEPEFPEALFHQMRAEFTGPVLLATRDLDRCAALADQMLVLDAGRVVRRGTPREVLDEPESV